MQFVFAGCVLDGDRREFTRDAEPVAWNRRFSISCFIFCRTAIAW